MPEIVTPLVEMINDLISVALVGNDTVMLELVQCASEMEIS